MNLNQSFIINSFLYNLFHILLIKTNYDHLEKLKSSVNLIAAFDHEINYTTIKKQKTKNLKVHPLNFEKVFNGIERKTWSYIYSSVSGLLNINSSSVNPLPLPDMMEVDSLRRKMFQ